MFVQYRTFGRVLALAAATCLGLAVVAVFAEASEGEEHVHHMDHMNHMDHKDHAAPGAGMDHSQHMAMMNKTGYQRSEHRYALPELTLVDQGGEPVPVRSLLEGDEPVMLNFIFTTCTTICPVMSATFAQVQEELGPAREKVRMVSVSIDPEHDTPERLREYAERYKAGPQWRFLTGDLDDSIAVQKAFDVYRGNKMSHEPTTLLRVSQDGPWVRLDGIASAAQIVAEYRGLAQH
jgi:protein SCO1/2